MARQDDLFKYVANTNGASCVVFRPSRQSKDLYLITAYHALEDEEHPTDNKILDEIVIRVSDVNINLDDYSYTCIYQSLPEDYDLLVFEIHNISNEDIEFHYLDIYHGDFERSVVVGYPQVKHLKDNTIKSFDTSSSVNTNGKHKNYRYTVSSNTSLFTENSNDMDSTKGFSGGGVFVLGADDDYHLAGIVIEAEYYSAFEYISISSLLRKINKQSKIEKIPSYKKQFFNEYNIDSNPDSLKEIIKKIMCSENEYFKDYSPQEPIDSHIEAQKNTISSKARTLNGQRKSLSEYYLFLGIHYHLEQKFSQSTKYFNRAVEFDIAKQEIFKSVAFDRKQIKSSKSARDKNISLFKGQALDRDEQKRLTEKVIIYTLARDTEDPRSISRLNDKDSDDLDKMLRSYLSNTNPEYKLEANYILAQLDKKTGERQVYCKKVIEVFLDNPIDDFTLYAMKCSLDISKHEFNIPESVDTELNGFFDISSYGVCFDTDSDKNNLIKYFFDLVREGVRLITNYWDDLGELDSRNIEYIYSKVMRLIGDFEDKACDFSVLSVIKSSFRVDHQEALKKLNEKYSTYSKNELIEILHNKEEQLKKQVFYTPPTILKKENTQNYTDYLGGIRKIFRELLSKFTKT